MTVDKKDIDAVLNYYFKHWFNMSDFNRALQNDKWFIDKSRKELTWHDIVLEAYDTILSFNRDDEYNLREMAGFYGYGKYIVPTPEFVAVLAEKIRERLPSALRSGGWKYVTVPFALPSHRQVLTYVEAKWDEYSKHFPLSTNEVYMTEKIRSFGRQVGTWKGNPDGKQNMEKSNIPMHLRAHKSTPKHKTGIRQLENSVRKMF